jgi:methionine-rich copper-binding protein CopC
MRKILVALAALIAGFALAFGGASAATAHSDLEESTPAQGSTVSVVTELVFTFGEEVVPDYSTVVLADSSDIVAELGTPTYDTLATTMTVPIVSGALPNGDYVAGFRIVSIDGHPISGEVDFTVAGSDAPALVPGAPTGGATATATDAAITPEEPLANDGSETVLLTSQDDGPSVLVIVGTIFAALGALGLVTVVLLVAIRRNRAKMTP